MTIVVRLEATVNPAKITEAEDWLTRWAKAHEGHSGFQTFVLLNSLGHPSNYFAGIRYESRQAADAYRKGPVLASFLKENPVEGLFGFTGPIEQYEVVQEPVDVAQYGGVTVVDWNIELGMGQAFIDSRKQVFDLRQRHAPGFVAGGVYRSLGDPRRFTVANFLGDADAELVLPPEELQFTAAHPPSLYTKSQPGIERYQVTLRVVG